MVLQKQATKSEQTSQTHSHERKDARFRYVADERIVAQAITNVTRFAAYRAVHDGWISPLNATFLQCDSQLQGTPGKPVSAGGIGGSSSGSGKSE